MIGLKRKIALRRLKRTCGICKCFFKKGDVYYRKRTVLEAYGDLFSFEQTYCARCQYKMVQRASRFEVFKAKCHHPIGEEVWSTIPGEAVMQPDRYECGICGKWL
ncbi:hypothetical protein EEL30_15505 [Brevibacillus laterosporus]|uniref:Uncharacterized protein n=1 Tax=Brevibacillus laterosporus TaxID=1465 RepID=A0A518V995_BRELA|nr:hypothetical protein EEL30_15505 [Brevibacillus laterosporus]